MICEQRSYFAVAFLVVIIIFHDIFYNCNMGKIFANSFAKAGNPVCVAKHMGRADNNAHDHVSESHASQKAGGSLTGKEIIASYIGEPFGGNICVSSDYWDAIIAETIDFGCNGGRVEWRDNKSMDAFML